jgi:hypothetical protein
MIGFIIGVVVGLIVGWNTTQPEKLVSLKEKIAAKIK